MAFNSSSNQDNDGIMAEINMTPLIDIMLVLLIIFMVTSSLSLESGLEIDLPKSSAGEQKDEQQVVIISLDKLGAVLVEGKKADETNLQGIISNALKEKNTKMVVFEGDTSSTLGKAIEIIDIAKLAGAEKFAIATEGESK